MTSVTKFVKPKAVALIEEHCKTRVPHFVFLNKTVTNLFQNNRLFTMAVQYSYVVQSCLCDCGPEKHFQPP